LRQKKEKHILTRGQEHLNATCMPIRKLLMMHWHHCEEVKQVTAFIIIIHEFHRASLEQNFRAAVCHVLQ